MVEVSPAIQSLLSAEGTRHTQNCHHHSANIRRPDCVAGLDVTLSGDSAENPRNSIRKYT